MQKQMQTLATIYFLLFFSIVLNGCASSGSTRVAASEADKVYIQTDYSLSHPNNDLRDAFQNQNQTTKGLIIGGLAGALVGSLYSSVGAIPGIATGAIIGGAMGAYVDAYTTPLDRLENRGVKVMVLGDQIMFVLPSYNIFNEYSATLRPQAYSTLDQLAIVICAYPNMSVKVSAFTSDCLPSSVNVALTQQQADAIVRYMTKRGVPTRLLYASGYGGTNLITQNLPEWSNDNNRIEITLEKLPV